MSRGPAFLSTVTGGNQSRMFTRLTHARTHGQTPLTYLELSSAQNVYNSSSNSVRFSFWVSTIGPLPRMLKNSYQNPNGTKFGAQERSIPACGPTRLQLGGGVGWGWGGRCLAKTAPKAAAAAHKTLRTLGTVCGSPAEGRSTVLTRSCRGKEPKRGTLRCGKVAGASVRGKHWTRKCA